MGARTLAPVRLLPRPRPALVTATLALVLLAGCTSSDDAPSGTPALDGAGSASASAPTYDRYLALGDSYTAAPGVPAIDGASGPCFRSTNNYPHLLAALSPGTVLEDRSCSGATSTDLTSPQRIELRGRRQTVPAQLDGLTPDTDLVTLSIGGNDNTLFGTVVGRCAFARVLDPRGAPCQAALGKDGIAELQAGLRGTQRRIVAAVGRIRATAPGARIVVVGYPQIVPASGTCRALPLATGDYPFARRANVELTRTLRSAATTAGVEYADLWEVTQGHDICADDPWVNGARTDPGRAVAFHPFREEQEAVAQVLAGILGQPAPTTS